MLLLGLLAGLVLRLGILAALPSPSRIVRAGDNDAGEYHAIARNLIQGDGFCLKPGQPTAYRPPLYPLLVAACGANPTLTLAVQQALALLSLGLVWRIARRVLGSPGRAFAALLAAALWPELAWFDALLLSEGLFTLLLLATVDRLLTLKERGRAGDGAVLGLLAALLALTRPVGLLLFPLFVALGWRALGWRGGIKPLGIAAVCFILGVAPWMIRNERALGAFVFSTNGGVNLYLGNLGYSLHGVQAGIDTLHPEGGEVERDRAYTRASWQWMRGHMGELPGLWVRKALRLWLSVYDYGGRPTPSRMALTVERCGLFFIFLLCFGWRRGWGGVDAFFRLLLGTLALLLTALHAFTHAEARYVMPLLPLIFIVLAGAGRRKRHPKSA